MHASAAGSQAAEQAPPGESRADQPAGGFVLQGRLQVGDEPAVGGSVVLHRVSAFFTGEVDSAAVGPGGAFELRVPEAPALGGGDVYFASARWDDVVYFGPAITEPPEPGSAYVVQAYPAAEAGDAPPPVRVRNLFLERAEAGPGWRALDLFEVRNAGDATLVTGPSGATWSYPLPPGAVEFAVGESDLSPDAASFSAGRVSTSAALRPGESVYLFRYRVPGDVLRIPLEGPTASMELLIREPAGELSVQGLAAAEPVELEGATYRRFAGREMAPATVVVRRGAAASEPSSPTPVVAAALAMVLAVAGAFVASRLHSPRGLPAEAARRQSLVEVAELDEAASAGKVGPEEHVRRREQILRRLGS